MKIYPFRYLLLLAGIAATGLTLVGCPKEEPKPGDAPYGQAAPPPPARTVPTVGGRVAPPGPPATSQPPMAGESNAAVPGAPPAGMTGGPIAGGPMSGGDPMAPMTPTPELDKAIQDATAKGDKKRLAAAYAGRGFSRMYDDKAGQRVRYRMALKDFRVALQNDPNNDKAKTNKKKIEDIYASMGRPVPE